jgi:hypothetical protein
MGYLGARLIGTLKHPGPVTPLTSALFDDLDTVIGASTIHDYIFKIRVVLIQNGKDGIFPDTAPGCRTE